MPITRKLLVIFIFISIKNYLAALKTTITITACYILIGAPLLLKVPGIANRYLDFMLLMIWGTALIVTPITAILCPHFVLKVFSRSKPEPKEKGGEDKE